MAIPCCVQFRRLAGGRNLKLKSESLQQIIELDECQVQGRIKDYQKYMTEVQPSMVSACWAPGTGEEGKERGMKVGWLMSCNNAQPKGPAPTNMQKKKHQLHYLIHQVGFLSFWI